MTKILLLCLKIHDRRNVTFVGSCLIWEWDVWGMSPEGRETDADKKGKPDRKGPELRYYHSW